MLYESDVARPDIVSRPSEAREASSRALGRHISGLDGIRGMAIVGVLLYHGDVAGAQGGFLAISQFFTLSGFLITGVLLRNHLGPGGRPLTAFWARRIRRLLPAALVALVGIVIFGATVATYSQAKDLPGEVASAATWTANWYFIVNGTSYVAEFLAPSPVRHFWSLSIEEQFYLVLPLALLVIGRLNGSRRLLLGLLGGAAVASTAWMAYLYHHGASLDRLYYGTDTRVGELLAGAALALVIAKTGTSFSRRSRGLLQAVGLASLLATVWCWSTLSLTDGAIWQGGFLVFSMLTCGLIVGALAGHGPLTAVLSLAPLVYLGHISYGLYLYHWPIYLWLTEDRTGLDTWPLFGVRLLVSLAAAIASFHLLERPVLRGASFGIPPRFRVAAVPAAVVLVVALGFVVPDSTDEDPLEALRASQADMGMPRVSTDGVLDLLVIPQRLDDPVLRSLRDSVEGDPGVELSLARPFECRGGLAAAGDDRTCAGWVDEWPALIEEHDPDVVVLLVDDWVGEPIDLVTGQPGTAEVDAMAEVLDPAFDLLTTKGARIVRASFGRDLAESIRQSRLPFNQAMSRLEADRTDVFKVLGSSVPDVSTLSANDFADAAAAAVLTDASLYQRVGDDDLPRVMVVGDSQSMSLGYGLERWGAEEQRATVWNRGGEGCGLVVDGEVEVFGGDDAAIEACREAVAGWPEDVDRFRPDLVVVLSSLADLQDRQLPGAVEPSSAGDPEFDAFLVEEYTRAVDVLSSAGATVVWMTAPCADVLAAPGGRSAYDSTQVEHVNAAIIPEVLAARPDDVRSFDLASVLCPGGQPLEEIDGEPVRPDGVHFSVAGARWFADQHGDELLRLATP